MEAVLVAVRDAKMDEFGPVMTVPTIGMGERQFVDMVGDQQFAFSKHPEDYSLWDVGRYETETGHVEATFPARLIITATAVVQAARKAQ